jgi:hypothetical protein
MRIIGEIRDAVIGDAANDLVDREYPLDRGVRLGLRAVGGEANEVRRLEEPTKRIFA